MKSTNLHDDNEFPVLGSLSTPTSEIAGVPSPQFTADKPRLSLVIPICNEEQSLEQLYEEICAVATKQDYSIQIMVIDDGSSDRSWEIIDRLRAKDERIHAIRFRRNFGKAAALAVAFDRVDGEIVVTLDGDLQDDPASADKIHYPREGSAAAPHTTRNKC